MTTLFESKNFYPQMYKFGFFAEAIPPCFTAEDLAEHADELTKLAGKTTETSPVILSAYKNEMSRRIISAANPYAFTNTIKLMYEHRKFIRKHSNSSASESPITFIHNYDGENSEHINSDLARELIRAKSDFAQNLRKRVALAMGYRFRLSIDIAAFYNSIYTHSITWAVCGKSEAKQMFSKAKPKSTEYNIANNLDLSVRNQKNKETNGILTGPFTSRIFSEILLAQIDAILQKRGYVFKRYVDDYKFYFRSESDAQKAVMDIAKILSEYNLSLNLSKLEIKQYPFDIESAMKQRLEEAFQQRGVYGLLNEAGRLHTEGEKGSYKYALKMLTNKELPSSNQEAILSILFNINLINPAFARYIIRFLRKCKGTVGEDRLADIVNNELNRSLGEGLEQETLNLLFFLRTLNLEVEGSLMPPALSMHNDFINVILLDLWFAKKDKVRRNATEARKINEAIKSIESKLQNQSFSGEHWLLLYEAKSRSYFDLAIADDKTTAFFNKLMELGVSFYQPDSHC